MRALLLLVLVHLAVGKHPRVEPKGAFGYHKSIGIPLATRIKAAEDRTLIARKEWKGPIGAYPYLAGLVISVKNINDISMCGSSLLSTNRLVTAAHCWFDGVFQSSHFTVVLGSNTLFYGGTRIRTSTVIMHPKWDVLLTINDIAMIYLPYNITFSPIIQSIAIPSGSDIKKRFDWYWARTAGYGSETSIETSTEDYNADFETAASDESASKPVDVDIVENAIITQVALYVITLQECQITFGSMVNENNICTSGLGGAGICKGDSGGPLVIHRVGKERILIGVGSFGYDEGCHSGYPSVFTRITSYNQFILQHM